MLSHDTPIVVIGDGENEEEAIMRLVRIGFDNVVGYLHDGMHSLEAHPDQIRKVARITAAALAEQISSNDASFVLDVRAEKEWNYLRRIQHESLLATDGRLREGSRPFRSAVPHHPRPRRGGHR